MFSGVFTRQDPVPSAYRKRVILLWFVVLWAVAATFAAQAQDTSQQPPANPNKQEAPPAAGGPQNDVGPYVVPKKKEEPPPPAPEKPKKIENMPDYSIKVAVLLVEFASTNYYFIVDALNASYSFANTLKKDDWVAVISYDMKPQILADFTQDKRAVQAALNQLRMPGFAETNLFDALFDTLDRVDRIEGKKYIILISTGVDTFSKLTLDKILKKVKTTKDVTIYPISVGWAEREWWESHGRAAPHGMGIQ